jgi:hypothetical protein
MVGQNPGGRRMKSAVPRSPMATLTAAAPSGPAAGATGRVSGAVPAGAAGVPTIVVAGAPRCGKTSVTNGLLAGPASALAPVLAHPEDAAGEVGATLGAFPVTSSYVSFRHGAEPKAYAYVPGRRMPRPLSVEQLRAGDAGMLAPGGPGRPPRRVEVLHPAELLRTVGLVDTPGIGGFDGVYTEIVLDALEGGAALLFVTEASAALSGVQLDFLAQVEMREVPVTFVLTKIDSCPQWPAVLAANQKLVHDHAAGLATSRWYAVTTLRSCEDTAPAAVEEAARGLAGLGLGALRRGLTEPAPGEPPLTGPVLAEPPLTGPVLAEPVPTEPGPGEPVPTEPPPTGPAPKQPEQPEQSGAGAPRVREGVTDARWTQLLDLEIARLGGGAGEQVAFELTEIHARCVRETNSPGGCARLASLVDRELHALSVRTTRTVDEAATSIMRRVFGEILAGAPDQAAVERIRRATRRAVEVSDSGLPEWDRVLLVTSTAGVAVTEGRGTVASLAAVGPPAVDDQLLPPIGVALSAGCYSVLRGDADGTRCRDWLHKTIQALEADLRREVAERITYLREALAVVAADTVDHGVLLA